MRPPLGTMVVMFNPLFKRHTVMKPWIKKTLIGVFGASLLAGGLTACGSHGGHRGGGDWSAERMTEMRGKAMQRISAKLDLNATQQQKLGLLADELMASRTAMRGQGGSPRTELGGLVVGEKFDRERALSMLTEKTQVVQTQGPKVVVAMADFYDSLNPQQQAQVRERLAERRNRWGRD